MILLQKSNTVISGSAAINANGLNLVKKNQWLKTKNKLHSYIYTIALCKIIFF